MKLRLRTVSLSLRAPFVSAKGAVGTRELLSVELEGSDGVVGYGEAAPLHSYDGVSLQACRRAIEDCEELLAASDGLDRETLLAGCWQAAVLPQAVAGIDLALWDLAARRAGQPVFSLLGAVDPPPVPVNATIASGDRAGAAREAAAAAEAGFGCVKVKVGLGDDAGRLAAVRAAVGPDTAIRIDANGCWSAQAALANLRALEPVDLELCEEPASGLDELSQVAQAASVPVAMDESTADPAALQRRVCQAVCLKITRSGGISGLVKTARAARAAGYEGYLASTLDGPLGIAAALHAAAVIRPDRPCGLATLSVFAGARGSRSIVNGHMSVPVAAGLGAPTPGD